MWTNVRVVIWYEYECPGGHLMCARMSGWSFDVSTNVRPCQKSRGNECPYTWLGRWTDLSVFSAYSRASNSQPSIFVWTVELSDHRYNFMTIQRSTAHVICSNSRSHKNWDSYAEIWTRHCISLELNCLDNLLRLEVTGWYAFTKRTVYWCSCYQICALVIWCCKYQYLK